MDDVGALKAFIDDNEDLERLETILDQFNLFESLGLVRHEIRHSAFLRWLLDPSETHGLGDYWLRQFLRQVIKAGDEVSGNVPTLFDLDGWNLGKAEVRKEWRNMDIFIRDDRDDHQFVCVIENKVDSGEGPDQLRKYRQAVQQEFPRHRRVFVFLTKFGDKPSEKREVPYWVPMSYGDLVVTIEDALKRQESQLNGEVRLFIHQYLDMVRRHIVENSEVQELCRKIYENHSEALDLIIKYAPKRSDRVSRVIQEYVNESRELIPIAMTVSVIKFLPKSMDVLQREDAHIGDKGFMLAWLLENKNDKVQFRLELQPGPQEIREQVHKAVTEMPGYDGSKKKLSPKWHSFYSETWITQEEYNGLNEEQIEQRMDERLRSFLERKGNAVTDALRELEFAETPKET